MPIGDLIFMPHRAPRTDASESARCGRPDAIPCVVSTGDGTRRIPECARVRVDGGEGTVTLL